MGMCTDIGGRSTTRARDTNTDQPDDFVHPSGPQHRRVIIPVIAAYPQATREQANDVVVSAKRGLSLGSDASDVGRIRVRAQEPTISAEVAPAIIGASITRPSAELRQQRPDTKPRIVHRI